MFIKDYMYKKAEENAHNEIMAFLLVILGINLLIGGLLLMVLVEGTPNLIILFSSVPQPNAPIILESTLIFGGFIVALLGFLLVIYYSRKRAWYMHQIENHSLYRRKEDQVLKSVDEILKEYTGKKKRE
ncbi:hypothetical protein J7L49_04660 [Candidatus Bathyarchaeota archaeon]|nr:hypothetical protein [Candidatus Bathyarchaeota archaeon]